MPPSKSNNHAEGDARLAELAEQARHSLQALTEDRQRFAEDRSKMDTRLSLMDERLGRLAENLDRLATAVLPVPGEKDLSLYSRTGNIEQLLAEMQKDQRRLGRRLRAAHQSYDGRLAGLQTAHAQEVKEIRDLHAGRVREVDELRAELDRRVGARAVSRWTVWAGVFTVVVTAVGAIAGVMQALGSFGGK